ncbi:unnamed protein product [Rotaria sp. Silwood1]|nr:unnamed protein product [Rotaria sp. Silwood1]
MSSGTSLQESTSDDRRLLHYTMKITDRLAAKNFFCNILGMKILRHEEMDSGCSARCNGDFDSPWSKTMVGYGSENSFFVFELNYNYDVQGYNYGCETDPDAEKKFYKGLENKPDDPNKYAIGEDESTKRQEKQ